MAGLSVGTLGVMAIARGSVVAMLMGLAACQQSPAPDIPAWPTENAPAADTSSPGSMPISLVPVPTASEAPPPEPSGERAKLVAADGQSAVLRVEPSSGAAAVSSAADGDRLQVLEAQRAPGGSVWYYTQGGDSEGWVEGKFVNFSEAYGSTSRPFVVLPGGGSVHAQPDAAADVLQELDGGSVIAAGDRYYNDGVWFYSGGGWISSKALFRPACIKFNGFLPLVVAAGGTTVHSTATYQIPVEDRLEGGELVFPSEVTQNSAGDWFKTDQGWVSGQSMFYPFCESASPATSEQTNSSIIHIGSKVR
ncbi:MAG: SH3 domain-containing protein [Elainellaceae cyanobacterium]